MADWVTGKVTKVQNWTDALFSLTVHAPINPLLQANLPNSDWRSMASAFSARIPMSMRLTIRI